MTREVTEQYFSNSLPYEMLIISLQNVWDWWNIQITVMIVMID